VRFQQVADPFHLDRFVAAQASDYAIALAELRAGCKRSHWIWYIFPQLAGLGRSSTAQHYAIRSLAEAQAYLRHPLLGLRLHECLAALDALGHSDVDAIFGSLDAMKFRSSLSLFAEADPHDTDVDHALSRWFGGRKDKATLDLLHRA
jgi:uncharacterized protein (DUF1810 family)